MKTDTKNEDTTRPALGYGTAMAAAAACLAAIVVVYAACMLNGEPLYGFEDPSYVLAQSSARLALALVVALAIGLALKRGLSAGAEGWQRAAVWVLLAAPPAIWAICYAANNEGLVHALPVWWAELALWPMLAALIAHAMLKGGRPIGRWTAAYFAACLAFVALTVCAERYQHDYVEFLYMETVAIAVWHTAIGGARGLGGRGRAALALLAAFLVACWLALVCDWRFWDVLNEPGYAGVWVSDRFEALQRFSTFDLGGWDVPPGRNSLFLVASVGGPAAAAAYAALSLASAALMALGCVRLSRRVREAGDTPLALAISSLGAAYGACTAMGLTSELLNITTVVGPVQGLGAASAAMLLAAALLGFQAVGSEGAHRALGAL